MYGHALITNDDPAQEKIIKVEHDSLELSPVAGVTQIDWEEISEV